MSVDEPPQGSKRAPSYSPSRSPASMRFYGALSQKQQRPSSASKKPPEPLQRAVADCLSTTVPNVHGNPFSLSSEAARILRDYLANPATVDMAYNVLLEHALAERDRRFHPSRQPIHKIRDVIQGKYDAPYISWKRIPPAIRDMWFQEFEFLLAATTP